MMSIWDYLPHPSDEHVVRTFWKGARGKRGGDFARNEKELLRFIEATRGKNAYIAPNPTQTRTGVRHTAADVTHWSYFLLDVDPLDEAVNPQPKLVLEEALLWLGEWVGRDFHRTRPLTIDSGRGMQAWLRLEDLHLYDSVTGLTTDLIQKDGVNLITTRKTARKAMGYWLKRLAEKIGTMHECRIDTSTSDLPRLMRCPGTINMKTGREASIAHPTDRVFGGLASLLVAGTPVTVFAEPDVIPVSGRSWQMAFSDLTLMAQRYLLNGQEEPGRHKHMWHTAKKLQEAGCTREAARKGLTRANELCGKEQELPPEEIERALDGAYKTT